MNRPMVRVALAGVASLLSVGASSNAQAQEVEPREAVVIARGGDQLDAGGSSTEFSLRLPEGAECPGDSAFEGWRVNSYMVPAAVNVTTLAYDGSGPTPMGLQEHGTFRQPLYDIETSSYVSALTAAVQERGEPGPIVDIPMFTFGVFSPGDVPAGRYHLGIACTLLNEVGLVWDAEIEIAEAADDEPAQFRWRVVGAESGGSGSGAPTALAVAAAAIAFLSIHTWTRRRRVPRPSSHSRQGASS